MTRRFFASLILGSILTLSLFWATALFSTTTQAAPVASLSSPSAAKTQGPDAQPAGTWDYVAPLPTISLADFYPCSPVPCTPQGVDTPARIKRAVAAAYPPNGKVYLFGGRHGLDGNEDFPLRWVFEYNPGADTWTQKNALLDGIETRERYVANMAAATLTDTNGPRIYVIGGTSIDSVPTPAVRVYDPNADAISVLPSADEWPANPQHSPGGWAVYDNKLYVFGGFSALGGGPVFADTWRFDPMAASGSKWTQLNPLSVARGYIAGAELDGKIYAVGGDTWDAGTGSLVPSNVVEMLDPSQPNPTWVTVASLPIARGDLQAWADDTGTNHEISGRIMIAGGPFPVPDANSYMYDPVADNWYAAPGMAHSTRNYAGAQLNGYLYAIGGYDYSEGSPNGANFVQRYDATSPEGTPTPTATGTPPTSTPTRTPSITTTPTATACVTAYNYVAGTSTIVPGTTDIGNHDDDLVTNIALPFPFSLYDQTYNSVNLSSNGNAQFTNSDLSPQRECLYSATLGNYAISPYWADLRTDGTNEGIFTVVQGTAPDRTFYIEWRTEYYDTGGVAHFELALHEGDAGRFDLIYGQLDEGNTSTSVGVQESNDNFTSYVCDGTGGALSDGLLLQFSLPVCATPTVTPIACTLQFEDVPVGSTFYTYIHCLACQGFISGYPCGGAGEPCNPDNDPYFRPANNVTRGQVAKIVSNAAGFSGTTGAQQFEDVPVGSTFFDFVYRLYSRGLINGYPCGGAGEPCGPSNLPYFRPNGTASRGQLAKIDANAAGFNNPSGAQQFQDVPVGSTFYDYIWRLADRGLINGYPCGGAGEPCGPGNLPYFRPSANVTRGQTSKIVSSTFFPGCQ
ncbi:MAG TPA: S-layer homology domain-containing protein [Chloroflexia bacterium]|nr:S-layer homology domain-containing protein [Chloroflexia bacterium]